MARSIGSIQRYILGLIAVLYSVLSWGQRIEVITDQQSVQYGHITLKNLPQDVISELRSGNFSNKQIGSFFFIRVGSSTYNTLGNYLLTDNDLTFVPRFLPDTKITHSVHFDPVQLSLLIEQEVDMPPLMLSLNFSQIPGKKTSVTQFYPELDTLPTNILRAYLYFNQPMSLQNPYEFIDIRDSNDSLIKEPFVEIPEGLWNKNRTRLTLLFHPGRIKRGVGPNMTHGALFDKNESYIISISNQWKDAFGRSIQPFHKVMFFGPAIRKPIDINNWVVVQPKFQSLTPLVIKVQEKLDHALVQRLLFINIDGITIDGQWEFAHEMIIFTPNEIWSKGHYQLIISPDLEDVCGNTNTSAFDQDGLTNATGQKLVPMVEFTIK